MKRIEFVGGSGVGKTTLLKEIIKLKKAKDCWMTVEEARQHLAKIVKPKTKLHKLFQLYLKINLIGIFHQQMTNRILNSYKNDVFDSIYKYYSEVADLIFEELCKNNNNNGLRKMEEASFYYHLLLNETMFFDYFKFDTLVVFDESIIKNAPMFSDEEKVKTIFENHKKLQTSLIPAGIVYCYLDRIKYLERRKNRIHEGGAPFFDRIVNDDKKLEKACLRSLKSAEEKIKVLKNYNIEILELNMEALVSVNAKKAYDFINKLSIKL